MRHSSGPISARLTSRRVRICGSCTIIASGTLSTRPEYRAPLAYGEHSKGRHTCAPMSSIRCTRSLPRVERGHATVSSIPHFERLSPRASSVGGGESRSTEPAFPPMSHVGSRSGPGRGEIPGHGIEMRQRRTLVNSGVQLRLLPATPPPFFLCLRYQSGGPRRCGGTPE